MVVVFNAPDLHAAAARGDYGEVLRLARTANGWSQQDLACRTGFDRSVISRYERGKRLLRDVSVLTLLARALGIPPELFGLASPTATRGRSTVDDVLRRELFLATGAIVASGRSPQANAARPHHADPAVTLAHSLDVALTDPSSGTVVDPALLPALLRQVRMDYRHARYLPMLQRLSSLIASAEAAVSERPDPPACAQLAQTYTASAHVLFKAPASGLEWIAADRAIRAAHRAEDPRLLAEARRLLCIAHRRAGWHDRAQELAVSAADRLGTDVHGMVTAELLCTAAYAAAKNGDRERAMELLTDADRIARKAQRDGQFWTAFGAVNVTVYRVSVFSSLGDLGRALAAVRAVNIGELPTAERRARFFVDAARAYLTAEQHGQARQALLIAARTAPQEMRTRPAARTLAATLRANSFA